MTQLAHFIRRILTGDQERYAIPTVLVEPLERRDTTFRFDWAEFAAPPGSDQIL
jgi:hypothetical protein